MGLYTSPSALVSPSAAANQSTVQITGLDLTPVKAGHKVSFGSWTKLSDGYYFVSTVTPVGTTGGSLTVMGTLTATVPNNTPLFFDLDPAGAVAAELLATLTLLLTRQKRFLGIGTSIDNNAIVTLDKDQAGGASEIKFTIGGVNQFRLRQTTIEYDTLKPEVVIDRLKAIAVPTSPWFGTAGEMVAAAYLKQGKRAEAGKLYGQVAQGGDNVPETIRQRAVQLAGVLGVDATAQPREVQAK